MNIHLQLSSGPLPFVEWSVIPVALIVVSTQFIGVKTSISVTPPVLQTIQPFLYKIDMRLYQPSEQISSQLEQLPG